MSALDWGLVSFIAALVVTLIVALVELGQATKTLRDIAERLKASNDEIESEVGEVSKAIEPTTVWKFLPW